MTKRFKNIVSLLLILFSAFSLNAQTAPNQVQMADGFYAEGKIYVVIGIVAIIFIGLAVYLFMIERKVKRLEEALKEKKN